jgi:uncharacterized membrane protein YqjE
LELLETGDSLSMTQSSSAGEVRPGARGIAGSVRRVVAHASSLARLERELARAELQRKAATVGAGAALAAAAAVLALFTLGFGLAAVAAALAIVVDWWLALLIVFVALLVLVVVLVLVARSMFRRGTPLTPEKALAEARLTQSALRSGHGD